MTPLSASALAEPPPTSQEMRGEKLCMFIMDYELAQRAIAKVEDALTAQGQTIPQHLFEQRIQLEEARILACTYACWDIPSCKEECLFGQEGCHYKFSFGRSNFRDTIDSKFAKCQQVYSDQLRRTCSDEGASFWSSWTTYFKDVTCPNPFEHARQDFVSLERILKRECKDLKDAPLRNVEGVKALISNAKQLAPTFESIYHAKIAFFSLYLCLASWLALPFLADSTACYQSLIDSYIAYLEQQLGYAQTYRELCSHFAEVVVQER
jgi:hypothetical protein